MDKIKTIIGKEWAEVFKNRLVLFTVAFLPLILIAVPIVTLFFVSRDLEGAEEALNNPETLEFFGETCTGLTEIECTQLYMLNLFVLMLMILPVAIPVTIAAYSVVGEKTSRSLEPLLATPITTLELLAGKIIAAAVPAILATWLSYGIFLLSVRLLVNETIFSRMFQPHWVVAILIVGPLLTILSVSVAIMVSSRTSDPRVAEQLSAVVMLPLILLIIGQSAGFILIDGRVVFFLALIVAILDVILLYISVRLFQRETILTRWK
jgi:ABC-2 type transport system permease protein